MPSERSSTRSDATPKYVFDADIAGCFDNISQKALVEKLHTYPAMRQAIQAWLEAGVMDGVEFAKTDKGTPQGGIITPPTMLQKKC